MPSRACHPEDTSESYLVMDTVLMRVAHDGEQGLESSAAAAGRSGGLPIRLRVDILHCNLETVETTRLRQLHFGAEALAEVFVDDAVRGGKEGEHVRDETLLPRIQPLPVNHVILQARERVG